MAWEPKAPGEVLDYYIDWTKDLRASEVIVTSTWVVPGGVNKVSDAHDDRFAEIWVSGGTHDRNYSLKNTVVTNQDRTMVSTKTLRVRNQ